MKNRSRNRSAGNRPADTANETIYGIHAVSAAIENPERNFHEIILTQNAANRLPALPKHLEKLCKIASARDIDRITGAGAVHQGAVARVAPLTPPALSEIEAAGIVVLLDQITDPHNVGAILRSCSAFSVSAVVTTSRNSPRDAGIVAKTASGGVEHVPLIEVTNLSRAMETLKDKNFTLIGLDSEASENLAALSIPPPWALVLGAEGKGLRQKTRKNCDLMARLDMPGAIKSLNVSNAAAISLYQLTETARNFG